MFFDQLQTDNSEYCMIVGDLNKYLDVQADRKGGSPRITKSANLINNFLEECEWHDLWRMLHPDQNMYTWRKKEPTIC